jgi:ubiquinone/menaquinone biosynthesis C-methylase UbiE
MTSIAPNDLSARLGVAPDDLKRYVVNFYTSLDIYLRDGELEPFVRFLNWGYEPVAGLPDESPVAMAPHALDGQAKRLVLEVVGTTPIDGRDVLDIGCGRGGAIETLAEFFAPHSLTGVDVAASHIGYCRKTQTGPHIAFFQGDAEALAFGDERFDIVTNIESSNAYPNIEGFYREVNRVLRTNGVFAYTDLLRAEQFDHARRFLSAHGFEIEVDRDIGANVIAARRAAAGTQLRSLNALVDGVDDPLRRNLFDHFLAPEGSAAFDRLADGTFRYRLLRCRKIAHLNNL